MSNIYLCVDQDGVVGRLGWLKIEHDNCRPDAIAMAVAEQLESTRIQLEVASRIPPFASPAARRAAERLAVSVEVG